MATTAPELREEIEYRRQAIDRDLAQLGDKVNPSQVARRTADRTMSSGRRRLRGMRDAVMGTADSALAKADSASSDLGGGVQDARDEVRRRTEGSPVGAGLVAFGLGMVVAAVWPSTEPERRAATTVEDVAGDRVREMAREEGQALAEELEPSARDAMTTMEDIAGDAARSVADTASGSSGSPESRPGAGR